MPVMVTAIRDARMLELIRTASFDVKSYTTGRHVVRIEAIPADYVAPGRVGLIRIFLDDDDRGGSTGDWNKDDDAALRKSALAFLLSDGFELYEV